MVQSCQKWMPHKLNPFLLIVAIQGIHTGKIFEGSEQKTKIMRNTYRAVEKS